MKFVFAFLILINCQNVFASEILIFNTLADIRLEKEAIELTNLLIQHSHDSLKEINMENSYSIIDPKNIEFKSKQSLHSLIDKSDVEIGQKAGSDFVISSNLSKSNNQFDLNVKMKDVKNANLISNLIVKGNSILKIKLELKKNINHLFKPFEEIKYVIKNVEKESKTKEEKRKEVIHKKPVIAISTNENKEESGFPLLFLFFTCVIAAFLTNAVNNSDSINNTDRESNASNQSKSKGNYLYYCCGRSYKTEKGYQKHLKNHH